MHPGLEEIVEWINNGVTRVDGVYIKTAVNLVKALNAKYPDPANQLTTIHLSRYKKRVKQHTEGYIIRDGEVCRSDSTPVEMIDPMKILKSFVQVAYETLMRHPEKIQSKDFVVAMRLLKDVQGLQDENTVADEWKEYQKKRRQKSKPKVIDITPRDALQDIYTPTLEDGEEA